MGAAGLTASAGVAGWIEMFLLRRTLRSRVASTGFRPCIWCDVEFGAWRRCVNVGSAVGVADASSDCRRCAGPRTLRTHVSGCDLGTGRAGSRDDPRAGTRAAGAEGDARFLSSWFSMA